MERAPELKQSWSHFVIYACCDADGVRYEQAVRRFKSIFATDDSVPVYYIPGNNDVR